MFRKFIIWTVAVLVMLLSSAFAADDQTITFHFYGADDCPPCVAFKRDHLATVQTEAQKLGFEVRANMISHTVDVPKLGVYGNADPLLREAAKQLNIVYPPIFFVSRRDSIVSVHSHNWSEALTKAKDLSMAHLKAGIE